MQLLEKMLAAFRRPAPEPDGGPCAARITYEVRAGGWSLTLPCRACGGTSVVLPASGRSGVAVGLAAAQRYLDGARPGGCPRCCTEAS